MGFIDGAIEGRTYCIGDSGDVSNTDTALQCSRPAVSRAMNTGRQGSDKSIAVSSQRPMTTARDRTTAATTSARQRTVVDNRLRTSFSAQPSLAAHTTRAASSCHVTAGAMRITGDHSTTKRTSIVDWSVDALMPKVCVGVRSLRPAPTRDPRTRPLLTILHQSAAQFFNVDDGGSQPTSSSVRHTSDVRDWKVELLQLYDVYGYQFCSLYKPAACARSSTAVDDRWVKPGSWTRSRSVSDAAQLKMQRRRRQTSIVSAASSEVSTTTAGSTRWRLKEVDADGTVSQSRRGTATVRPCFRRTVSDTRSSHRRKFQTRSAAH